MPVATPIAELLTLQEAASILGYSVKGLRKIVDRSRAKASGARTRGPTIRFFQAVKGSPVKFRQEWLEEFIEQHTVNPSNGVPKPRKHRSKVTLDFD